MSSSDAKGSQSTRDVPTYAKNFRRQAFAARLPSMFQMGPAVAMNRPGAARPPVTDSRPPATAFHSAGARSTLLRPTALPVKGGGGSPMWTYAAGCTTGTLAQAMCGSPPVIEPHRRTSSLIMFLRSQAPSDCIGDFRAGRRRGRLVDLGAHIRIVHADIWPPVMRAMLGAELPEEGGVDDASCGVSDDPALQPG